MRRRIRWLFLVPLVAVVWTPLYAEGGPSLGPFPFVIWYQFALVAFGCLLTVTVYLIERESSAAVPVPAEETSEISPAD
ncbi:MAG: DUF3311 domain-containing protein [Actinobacteria bacterium]|nr:DUF3311 domain-containing protein [Actinomycetota bacterium]